MSELVSTRDPLSQPHSYGDALIQGLAADGGLFVPAYGLYPDADLHLLAGKNYPSLAAEIVSRFIGASFPFIDLSKMSDEAYSGESFDVSEIGNLPPVQEILPNIFVADLSTGPTEAFKDYPMQFVGRQMDFILSLPNGEDLLLALGATTGDTGPAAEAALATRKHLGLVMLSPNEGMAPYQKGQMGMYSETDENRNNITNVTVNGNFDDCQALVKQIMGEEEFKELGAVNSINWGRVVAQIPYYFSAYFQAVGDNIGDPVDFVVPSGNFGNMMAGHIARKMGLPIRNLIAATNENNTLDNFIQRGEYFHKKRLVTSSPSMDIAGASNIERLVYELLGCDPVRTIEYAKRFKAGHVDLKAFGLPRNVFCQAGIDSGTSTHEDRIKTIQDVYVASNKVIDPHTADAVHVARHKIDPKENVKIICLGTASPVKFEHTIREALDFVPPRKPSQENVEKYADTGFTVIDPDPAALRVIVREARARLIASQQNK